MAGHFIGVDVGTGSARAGVFDAKGLLLATSKHEIVLYKDDAGHVEQSSAQIWEAVCAAVRDAVAASKIDPATVRGIGFDATCSLVVQGAAAGVGEPAHPERDVIVWMDHRALGQASRINATKHPVLSYVGGTISPEMETPKLLWLKENRPDTYGTAAHFFDLTDYLTWKATGSLARSSCTVTCKWTYLAHEGRWDESYFRQIGLGDLADEGFARIGQRIVPPGSPLGSGLTTEAAEGLGLRPGVAVGAGLIDAHAGGVGTVAARGGSEDPTACLGYVFGTSSCTMATTTEAKFVPGVWGPYFSAMVPGMWLNEGGQSAAGAAIDQLLMHHPAFAAASVEAGRRGQGLPQWLAQRVLAVVNHPSDAVRLAGQYMVVPEFLGNRAPFADPSARAVVAGIGMETGVESLAALYVAGLCGLGYGLRQIIDTQSESGVAIKSIAVSGGAGTHPLTRQIIADATGMPVVVTECPEPVLLGSAMLGAVAAGAFPDLVSAMPAMSAIASGCEPSSGVVRTLHEARYRAFLRLQALAHDVRKEIEPLLDAGPGGQAVQTK
jgi:D-ribulokinase